MTEKRKQRARTLTCAQCGNEFEHKVQPGQPPKRCASCREDSPSWRAPDTFSQSSFRLSSGDKRMLKFIEAELGCNGVDAMRTALRVYAGILSNIKKSPRD